MYSLKSYLKGISSIFFLEKRKETSQILTRSPDLLESEDEELMMSLTDFVINQTQATSESAGKNFFECNLEVYNK